MRRRKWSVVSGQWSEREGRARPSCYLPPSPLPPFPPSPRSAFTLIELLITIVVIAILASVMLGALARASTSAKTMATRSRIAKLHNQVMLRWESYRTRRLPIDTTGMSPAQAAEARLVALRELMRIELPQQWSDISQDPVLIQRTSLSLAYKRRYDANPPAAGDLYQQAECLYMIVTMGLEDNSLGTDQGSLADIGDLDGDGHPEFHDAWGNPIRFLRWAPGFVSDLQPVDAGTGLRDPIKNHDPFDPRRIDPDAFALYPLIYSAGPDGIYDIDAGGTVSFSGTTNYYDPAGAADFYTTTTGRPFDGDNNSASGFEPANGQLDHSDNIHNHLIQVR